MRSRHEADLRWLLDGSAEAALGAKSAHASFVARLEGSTGNSATDESDIQDRLCEAARRERRIRDLYTRCSHRSQRVLAAWARPDKRVLYWGPLTHVVPLCAEYDKAKHGKVDGSIALRMAIGNPTADQKATALALRRAAEQAIAEAFADYAAVAAVHERGAA